MTPMCWTPSRDLVNSTLSVTTSAPYSSRERTTAHHTKRLSAAGMGPQRRMGPITACLALALDTLCAMCSFQPRSCWIHTPRYLYSLTNGTSTPRTVTACLISFLITSAAVLFLTCLGTTMALDLSRLSSIRQSRQYSSTMLIRFCRSSADSARSTASSA